MAIDDNKYQLLIDGTDYIQDIDGELPFVPVIQRDAKYHSTIATFSQQRLSFTGAAAAYLRTQKERGLFAMSTFQARVMDYGNDQYSTFVNGSIDFKTYEDDEVNGQVSVLFAPDETELNVKKRATIETNLNKLEDMNGDSITSFGGRHGETYEITVPALNIPGYNWGDPTTCEVMLAWEVFQRLAQKILGKKDALRSNLLGRTDGSVFRYKQDGRLAFASLTNGGLIRGGSLSSYRISTSLDAAFDWLNQIEPIGMGIEYFDGVPFLVVEEIEYFYNRTETPVVSFDMVDALDIRVNPQRVYGRVLTGYRNFKTADSGYTELTPFTTRRWITGLDKISDESYNTRTNVVANPYLIEVLRNSPISNGESNEADEWNFTFMLKRDTNGEYIVDQDFVSSTAVNNMQIDLLNDNGNWVTTPSSIDLSGATAAVFKVGVRCSANQLILGCDSADGIGFGPCAQNASSSACMHSNSSNLYIDGVLFAALFNDKTRGDLATEILDGNWHELEWTMNCSAYSGQVDFNRYQPLPNTWEVAVEISHIFADMDADGTFEYKWSGTFSSILSHDALDRTGTPSVSTQSVPISMYNWKLFPGRNVLDHAKVFNTEPINESRYQSDPNLETYLYQYGQGNDEASSQIGSEAALISENADLSAGVEPMFYADDLEISAVLAQHDYVNLVTGTNLNIWVPVTYNGTTRYGFIDRVQFLGKNQISCIFKWANEQYTAA